MMRVAKFLALAPVAAMVLMTAPWLLGCGGADGQRPGSGMGGALATGGVSDGAVGGAGETTTVSVLANGTTNLFVSLLGKSPAAAVDKVTTAVNRYLGIGTNESATPTAGTGYRCYYELSNDTTMGYIWAADSNDVRSESMSYGMMIAAQMNLQTQLDHLWNFAKKYMQIAASGSLQYFFNWQGEVNGTSVSFNNSKPAPDGDQYFAAALYVADQRWGSAGTINYKQEADNVANAFMHNAGSGSNCTIFNQAQHQVVFFPLGTACNFTDPSYHLPAFYELFALYGPVAGSSMWKAQAAASRAFLALSAHSATGLHPDYATFVAVRPLPHRTTATTTSNTMPGAWS